VYIQKQRAAGGGFVVLLMYLNYKSLIHKVPGAVPMTGNVMSPTVEATR